MVRTRFITASAVALVTLTAPRAAQEELSTFERDARLFLGPVAGLTDAWRVAPHETAVPLGTTITLEQILAPEVLWSGAQEVSASEQRSTAVVRLNTTGRHEVRASFVAADGEPLSNAIVLHVVDIAAEEIRFAPIRLSAESFHAAQAAGLTNDTTQAIFDRAPSIAAVTELGPGRYRTSTWRKLRLRTRTEPAGFEPLVDWRLDGTVLAHGADATMVLPFSGQHVISTGTAADAPSVQIETYDVEVVSSLKENEQVPENEPVTWTAVTDPPGFEDEVVWMPTTRYGSVLPAVGYGESFTAVFQGVMGPDGDRATGVVADHARFARSTAAALTVVTPMGTLQLPIAYIQSHKTFIGSMQPIVGGPGTAVMFEGNGFGEDVANLTVAGETGSGKGFPFRVVASSGNCVMAEVITATSLSDTPTPPTIRNVMGVVESISFGSVDFGDVKASCAPQDALQEAVAPEPFTVTGTVLVGAATAHAFVFDEGEGTLSMNVPAMTAGQSALLVLGVCWSGGWDQVLMPESGVFGIPNDLSESAAAITLTFGLDAAFSAANIACSVAFDGFDKITVTCPDVLDEEGFLYGYLIVAD